MNLLKLLPVALALAIAAGCASHPAHSQGVQPVVKINAPPPPIVTVDSSLTAHVISYNQTAQYVVLGFPSSQLPKLGSTLFLYRNGLKTAELKVSGPRSDNNIVADVVTGDVKFGDEVRDQ